MQRLRVEELSRLPRSRLGLPRTVPSDPDDVASLLVDPPGRALLAYHPAEGYDDVPGWAGETVLLYGADRRWRRLDLDDLGLPADAWPGLDTYGAGALSPDGRWWAGKSRDGVVLVDLATARHHLVETGGDWVAEVHWVADGSAVLVSAGGWGPAQRVTVPGLEVTEAPYRLWQVGVEPDGSALSLRRVRVGEAELVEHADGRLVPKGTLRVPRLGRGLTRMWGVSATAGRFAVIHQPRLQRFRRVDLLVVDTDGVEVEAVLRYDNRDSTVHGFEWLDPRTLLIDTDTGVLAWRPTSGRLTRVVDVPASEPDEYWTIDVAAGAAGGAGRATGR